MRAVDLLKEYVRRHNAAVESGNSTLLADLFAADGEIAFHGVPRPVTRGRGAIERVFRESGPGDLLVLGDVVPGPEGHAHAVYGWARAPGCLGGTLRLRAAAGRIARLDVIVLRDGPKPPSPREAARAIVVTSEPRVLLLRCSEPATSATWWITPGGGVEPGETVEEALHRELAEEVGATADPALCRPVWTREHVFTWGQNAVRQHETYFWVPYERAVVLAPRFTAAQLAAEGIGAEARWWSPADLRAARDDVFAPRRFPALLETLLKDGPPATPFDVGV